MNKPTKFRTQIQQDSLRNAKKSAFSEHPDLEKKESAPLGSIGLLPHRPTPQYKVSKQMHLIHRKKQKETAKMGRQRNNPQMKEKKETPEKGLNKIGASNLSDIEFKIMVIGCSMNL